jgi:pyrimidine-nucleoside phosphorylase
MRFLDLIEAKKHGAPLDEGQIRDAIAGYVAGEVPDYQMAALLMAIRWRGLDDAETRALTRAMVDSGTHYRWDPAAGPAVDKHSTGGVGDKVSLVLAPLAAAAGCVVPMISGRGLGHTGGTLDKLESIPGFRTDLDAREFRETIASHGVALGAQTDDLVPADRLLYALRDATGTVDDTGLITASILSKKIAEGAAALVLDVKVGSGAFFESAAEARALATRLRDVAVGSGLACSVLLTDMSQPLGRAVGNAVEVAEAMECLAGGGPNDLREVTLALGAEMLRLTGLDDNGRDRLERLLDDGTARQKFLELVAAQGGDVEALVGDELPRAKHREIVTFDRGGYLSAIDTRALGLAAIALRAGRDRREDSIDPAAGLTVAARLGDAVRSGGNYLTLHYNEGADVDRARRLVHAAVTITDDPPEVPPLIHELIQ